MSDSIIKVENLGKQYIISHEGGESYTALRDVMAKKAKKIFSFFSPGKVKKYNEEFWALKEVSFEVKKGEAIGIIGRNGAGKSTLLKVLSRITEPSTGRIELNGRIASLLEVGTGFHPELTGRENIFLNGAILGMGRAEIRKKFDEIVDFSGVEKFLDTPVKRYSSGMYVRLAFSVAAHLEPEILVVDEVLAVGDAEFQKKCLGKMEDVSKQEGRTVLLVSHNLGSITQLCSKGILLDKGSLVMLSTAEDTVQKYLLYESASEAIVKRKPKGGQLLYVESAKLVNKEGQERTEFRYDEDAIIQIQISTTDSQIKLNQYKLLVTIIDASKNRVTSAETSINSGSLSLLMPSHFLTSGRYSINFIIYIPGVSQFDKIEDCLPFSVIDTGSAFYHLEGFNYGVVFGKFSWLNN